MQSPEQIYGVFHWLQENKKERSSEGENVTLKLLRKACETQRWVQWSTECVSCQIKGKGRGNGREVGGVLLRRRVLPFVVILWQKERVREKKSLELWYRVTLSRWSLQKWTHIVCELIDFIDSTMGHIPVCFLCCLFVTIRVLVGLSDWIRDFCTCLRNHVKRVMCTVRSRSLRNQRFSSKTQFLILRGGGERGMSRCVEIKNLYNICNQNFCARQPRTLRNV